MPVFWALKYPFTFPLPQYVRKLKFVGVCNFRYFNNVSRDKQRNFGHLNLVKKNFRETLNQSRMFISDLQ